MTQLEHVLAAWSARMIAVDDLTAGTRVVVGCSGGADSLALLALARAVDLDVIAVYVDHGLRDATAHEVEVVGNAAAAFGASMRSVHVDVDRGPNLEARARDARYTALEEARTAAGAAAVLVAHTRDDQAETVLLQLLRGSGAAGLAGMPARRGVLRRPLLGLRRADTNEICARLRLAPVHDPMNDELQHRRVWLRREIVPRLEQGADRDVVEILARQADVLRDDDVLLDELAAGHDPRDANALVALPRALGRRVVRAWLGRPVPSLATVDSVLAVARGERRAAELPGGGRVERAGNRLDVIRPGEPVIPASAVPLPLPGHARFGALDVETWVEDAPPTAWPDGQWIAVVDADRAGLDAELRVARRGERFRPLGATGSKLVRDALAEVGVPASRRDAAAVVASGGSVWWVVGYRIADHVRVTARTQRYLWLRAEAAP